MLYVLLYIYIFVKNPVKHLRWSFLQIYSLVPNKCHPPLVNFLIFLSVIKYEKKCENHIKKVSYFVSSCLYSFLNIYYTCMIFRFSVPPLIKIIKTAPLSGLLDI